MVLAATKSETLDGRTEDAYVICNKYSIKIKLLPGLVKAVSYFVCT